MSIYKNEQTTYNPLKKKYVPLWRLDTDTVNVTHFNADTLIVESKIEQYLDDMEHKVNEAITRQVELRKQTDSCYQKAVLSGDAEKMLGLESCV
ncbi:MAG: hypothetical protein NC489_03210 [Ruminococcus flavefaciens]|nr:hypothetical protein [Ruminococcus flavefaciens]